MLPNYLKAICYGHVHCKTCRDLSGGRTWRESLLPNNADFKCPESLEWTNANREVENKTEEKKTVFKVIKNNVEKNVENNKKTDECPPHTSWCVRFGISTGESGCKLCSSLRESSDPEDRETYAWLIQQMFILGGFNRMQKCKHLYQRENETETKRCCGNKEKEVPVFRCKKHEDNAATCYACNEKET